MLRDIFLCVEIYKAINNLNPIFVEQIFLLGETNRSVREILNIPNLNILHTGTNDLKSVNSPEEIANEIISSALSIKENGQQTAVSGIREDRFSKKTNE